jgi:hypothetical protein
MNEPPEVRGSNNLVDERISTSKFLHVFLLELFVRFISKGVSSFIS